MMNSPSDTGGGAGTSMVRHGMMDEVQRALMSDDVIQTWNVIQQDAKPEHRNSRRDTRHGTGSDNTETTCNDLTKEMRKWWAFIGDEMSDSWWWWVIAAGYWSTVTIRTHPLTHSHTCKQQSTRLERDIGSMNRDKSVQRTYINENADYHCFMSANWSKQWIMISVLIILSLLKCSCSCSTVHSE